MDNWSNTNLNQYVGHLPPSNMITSSLGSLNFSGFVDHQSLASSGFSNSHPTPLPAHEHLNGTSITYNPLNATMLDSITHMATNLPNQQRFRPLPQSLFSTAATNEMPLHLKSHLVANHEQQSGASTLMPSNITSQDFSNICQTWSSPPTNNLSVSLYSGLPLETQAPKNSNEISIFQKQPPPAHSGNRPSTTQKNFKGFIAPHVATPLALPLSDISSSSQSQFSAKNLTTPNSSLSSVYLSNIQKFADAGAIQKLVLGQQVYVEGSTSTNTTKILADVGAIRITNQPLHYISMQATTGSNSIVLIDKNHFSNPQNVVRPQTMQQALHQNLTQDQGLPVSQYSQLPCDEHLTNFSHVIPIVESQNGNFISSECNESVVIGSTPFLSLFAGPQSHEAVCQIGLNPPEAVQAMADSTTKPKRGSRASGKANGKPNLKTAHPDDNIEKKKPRSRRIVGLKEGSIPKMNQNIELLSMNPSGAIPERSVAVDLPTSFCHVDPTILTQTFEPETFTSRDAQVFLTNVFGSSFVDPNGVVGNEESSLLALRHVHTGGQVKFSADCVKTDKNKIITHEGHQPDEEFSHLIDDPVSLISSRNFVHPKVSKRTFMDCFIDFLHGKRQETLSSLSNVPITKKPDLPKYVPDVRTSREVVESHSGIAAKGHIVCVPSTNYIMAAQGPVLNSSKSCRTKRDSTRAKCSQGSKQNQRKRHKNKLRASGRSTDGCSSDTIDFPHHDDEYDSDKDPLWSPEKPQQKYGSKLSGSEKVLPKRRRINKMLESSTDTMEFPLNMASSFISKDKDHKESSYQKGDFLVEKKDVDEGVGMKLCNIWRVDSCRLLQKYEPIMIKDVLLHQPSCTYSSWSEDMQGNYLLVKTQQPSMKSKAVKVLEVVREDSSNADNAHNSKSSSDSQRHSRLGVDHQQQFTVDKKEPFNKVLKLPSHSSHAVSSELTPFQQLDKKHLQQKMNTYIEALIRCCLHDSLDFPPCSDNGHLGATEFIDVLLSQRQEEVKRSIQWKPEFQAAVEQHSSLEIYDIQNKEMPCQATGRERAEKVVKLYGIKHHPKFQHVVQEVDEENFNEFFIGLPTAEMLLSYHELHIIKFQLFSWCKAKVNELKKGGSDESCVLNECINDKPWMSLMRDKFFKALRIPSMSTD